MEETFVCVHICTCKHGLQRLTLSISPHALTPSSFLFLFETVNCLELTDHWLGWVDW